MSGLFGSFNVAVKGLNANQTALHTTGHNISNANTPGFNRQRVELTADTPFNVPGVGQLGTGVRIQSVVRVVDEFVDNQIRNENSILAQYEAQYDTIGQIEMVFNEPSNTGLNFAMGEMFNAWQELSKNPESLNAKTIVVEKSKAFADTLNHMANRANQLQEDVVGNVHKNVFDVNSLVTQLNTVNDQIANIQLKGHSANDLMDTRDQLLQGLSTIGDITTSFDTMGRASVKMGGETITGKDSPMTLSSVASIEKDTGGNVINVTIFEGGDTSKPVTISGNTEGLKVGQPIFYTPASGTEPNTLQVAEVKSGALGGNLNSMEEIENRVEDLTKFAEGVKYMFNSVHNPDNEEVYDPLTPDIDFFTGENALDFQVNALILQNEGLVRTGDNINSPDGDGSRALAIANLRNVKIDFNSPGTDTETGNTMEGAYGDIVIKVGVKTEQASNMMDNQTAVLAQLYNRRESVSGVSIDEEVTNLLKFQRSYEANSRVINTINEMLDVLINRTGV